MSVHIFGAAFGLALAFAKGDAPIAAAELEQSIASEKGQKVRLAAEKARSRVREAAARSKPAGIAAARWGGMSQVPR